MASRRSFMAWIGAFTASSGVRVGRGVPIAPSSAFPGEAQSEDVLDPALLTAVGEVVLPGELGREGVARAVREFSGWLRGYRPGAELLHAYGSGNLGKLPASPVPRWASQLRALNDAAQAQLGKSFGSASRAQREALVRSALARERVQGMPAPLTAPHVALALLGWFYRSPGATDLCYQARIEKNGCRPLADNPKEPAEIRAKPRALNGAP